MKNSSKQVVKAFVTGMSCSTFHFRKAALAFILLGILFFHGCNKNENDNDSSTENEITVDLVVLASDEQGADLSGVDLKVGSTTGVTDQYGSCIFENVKVPSNRYYIAAEKAGYFSSGYGGTPDAIGTLYVRIKLLSKGSAAVFNSSGPSSITTVDNAQVDIPANAIKNSDGTAYSGQVKVYSRMINQDDPQFSTLFPGGDLASINSSGQLAQLESYGMLGVEMEDGSGNQLNLDGSSAATVRMPIAASQLSTAPDSIPLLHFDEEKGVWIQDGYAYKTGSYYEGAVSHFSWWNCDIQLPTPTPVISGRVVDCAGNPVPGCVVSVNGIYTLNTNSQGEYSSWIPSGIPVVVSVDPQLNSGIYPAVNSQSLTTAPGVNSVPDIVLNCPASITGQVLGCEGITTPVYVRAVWPNNGNTMLLYFPNGDFQLSVTPNQTVQLTLSSGSSFKDTTVISPSWGSNVHLGTISLCGTSGGAGCGGTTSIADIDGNVYGVVSIGGQCWMAENLKTTKYRNGTSIPAGLTGAQWNQTTSSAYAVYNDLPANSAVYGHLYNWYTMVDPAGLCPTGWHVPTDAEWDQMVNANGGQAYAGGHLKQIGTIQSQDGLWQSPNTAADNLTGFTGLPGGYRNYDGTYAGIGYTGYWATSSVGNSASTAWFRSVNYNDGAAIRNDNDKRIGFSVRCVKD